MTITVIALMLLPVALILGVALGVLLVVEERDE